MMSKPEASDADEQICPLCKKIIREHSPKEMLECSRKLQDQEKTQSDDSGN